MNYKYKGWQIKYDALSGEYLIYTPEELEQPAGFRQEEAVFCSPTAAKYIIDHYND